MQQIVQATLLAALAVAFVVYAVYQQILHPLARYPGPFWASITNFWNAAEHFSGQQPYRLTRLHEKYGPVVRYAPNKLSFTSPDVVNTVYIKGFKTFPKTEFYDTFGSAKAPHLFIHKDPSEHALRRRLLLKSFSPQAVERYETIIDANLERLRAKIRGHSDACSAFDLKRSIYLCVCDIMSAAMYGQDWNIQQSGEAHRMPDDHTFSLFNAVLGAWPSVHFLAPLQALLPHPQTGLREMRNVISYVFEALRYYRARKKEIDVGIDVNRADVITSVINSIEKSDDGAEFWNDFNTINELLGFVFAGIHPPSATITVLFWNLLHHPDIMQRASLEIEQNLAPMTSKCVPYSSSDVEQHLPYLRLCVKESFRITPVFTMPLERRVMDDETVLNGRKIPRGTTVAICNHAFHHNPEVWGSSHNVYDPDRWDSESGKELSKLLMHFGAGGRQCIGKVLATSIIYKLTSTILGEFSFQLADTAEQEKATNGGFKGKLPPLENVSISDVRGPTTVYAKQKETMDT